MSSKSSTVRPTNVTAGWLLSVSRVAVGMGLVPSTRQSGYRVGVRSVRHDRTNDGTCAWFREDPQATCRVEQPRKPSQTDDPIEGWWPINLAERCGGRQIYATIPHSTGTRPQEARHLSAGAIGNWLAAEGERTSARKGSPPMVLMGGVARGEWAKLRERLPADVAK